MVWQYVVDIGVGWVAIFILLLLAGVTLAIASFRS